MAKETLVFSACWLTDGSILPLCKVEYDTESDDYGKVVERVASLMHAAADEFMAQAFRAQIATWGKGDDADGHPTTA